MELFQQIPLFDNDGIKQDNSPVDTTQIVQTILYHSLPENKEFRRLCKEGIKAMYPQNFQERGNISDFLFDLVKLYYGNITTPAIQSGAAIDARPEAE